MAKKPTIREIDDRVNLMASNLNFTMRMMESIGVAFSSFVRFIGKEE